METQRNILWLQKRLLQWFAVNQRDLPWRKTHDTYKILVSEIMLQQTGTDRVIPKYHAFLREFPTAQKLAVAPTSAVIRAWSGLGHNRRAIYLKQAAQEIVNRQAMLSSRAKPRDLVDRHAPPIAIGGARDDKRKFPQDIAELEKLPGVGTYTARAIAAFAFEKDVAAVDTNWTRVLYRWLHGVEVPKRKVSNARLLREAALIVPTGEGWTWNHAMMDFGSMVCTAKRPQCQSCPMRQRCRAYFVFRSNPVTTCRNRVTETKRSMSFVGSNRYWRGRIIELLRHATGHSLPLSQLVQLLGSEMSLALLRLLVISLVHDQLVVVKHARIFLPE